MCILGNVGATIDSSRVPNECTRIDDLLFSESHSRFIVSVENDKLTKVTSMLESNTIPYGVIGKAQGSAIIFSKNNSAVNISIDKAADAWLSMERLVEHG